MTMPSGGCGGGDQDGRWRHADGRRPERVEGGDTVISSERGPGGQILHRKTDRVKLNGRSIDGGVLTDRKKSVSDVRGDENVIEVEQSREYRGTYRGDGKSGTVSNDDRCRVCGRRWV
jgi:hypothetical protein